MIYGLVTKILFEQGLSVLGGPSLLGGLFLTLNTMLGRLFFWLYIQFHESTLSKESKSGALRCKKQFVIHPYGKA
jgi:hypothetical protein